MTEFGLNATGNTLILTALETVDSIEQAKDVSAATTLTFLIKKPDEVVISVTASFNTDGTDGKLIYAFVTGDLPLEGLYEVQIALVTPTWSDKSTSYFFTVRDTLVAP